MIILMIMIIIVVVVIIIVIAIMIMVIKIIVIIAIVIIINSTFQIVDFSTGCATERHHEKLELWNLNFFTTAIFTEIWRCSSWKRCTFI